MLRPITRTTNPNTAITVPEDSAYEADSLTTRSTSYSRYFATESPAPRASAMMATVMTIPATVSDPA